MTTRPTKTYRAQKIKTARLIGGFKSQLAETDLVRPEGFEPPAY
jgi:hypothetical protein